MGKTGYALGACGAAVMFHSDESVHPCVLIIDDDPDVCRWFGRALADLGVLTQLAATGREGIIIYGSVHPQVVLVDLRMPDMSGLEVLQAIGPSRPVTEVIVISGFADVPAVVEAMRLGATNVLEKPIRHDKLVETVSDALERTALSRYQTTPVQHALRRWAELVAKAVISPADVRTLSDWGRLAATSTGALRNWCRTAGLPPKRSLLLARMLRAVVLAHRDGLSPENILDVADRRTLVKMLVAAGCQSTDSYRLPTVQDFLTNQRFINHGEAIAELVAALARAGEPLEASAPSHGQ